MLQLNTGKFYSRIGRTNDLKGVLYTNLRFDISRPIMTRAGTLTWLDSRDSNAVLYELTERLEYRDGPLFLMSHTLNAYAPDFAVIASFGLNGLCATDSDTIVRLTEGGPRIGVSNPVRQLVPSVFEKEIFRQPEQTKQFEEFVDQLMSLEQHHYAAALSAMKTYMTALVRISDDCELAYTLLVASVESLAQQFDGHIATWDDYDSTKRTRLDQALQTATPDLIQKVRDAILENEHVALARRFKDFTLSHLGSDYFRPQLNEVTRPIGRGQLEMAIKQAYTIRSKHVHTLQDLPRDLKNVRYRTDYMYIEGVPVLTFEGLTRLVRHVITSFVKRGPKVDSEELSPSFLRYGMSYARMAAKYWIANAENVQASHGKSRLEGFLEQFSGLLLKAPQPEITDLADLFPEVQKLLQKKMRTELRRPYVALFILFFSLRIETWESTVAKDFIKAYGKYLESPSVEAWLVYMLLAQDSAWTLSQYSAIFSEHMRKRNTPGGLKMPEIFEMAMGLQLAELYRKNEDAASARRFITHVVDQFPGDSNLRDFETNYLDGESIEWKKILLPLQTEISPYANNIENQA